MKELEGRVVLLLSPKFFGYELEIKKEIEGFGSQVYYFDERPKNDFFTKICIRLNIKFLISWRIKKYYNNILKQLEGIKFDYVFLLNVETVPLKFIEEIRNRNSMLSIVTYFWDSVSNRKQFLKYLKCSDKFYSFEVNDENNKEVYFLPLFYIKDYCDIANSKYNITYDISFIGTVHSDRFKVLKEIECQLSDFNLNCYWYLYSPSRILFLYQKLFKKGFKSIKWSDVSFNSLNRSDVVDVVGRSKCVIDIQSPLQTGLTIRTIEMLGARKKLLTSNHEVKKYNFYKENNIYVFDRANPIIDSGFFKKNYEEIDQVTYDKYSISEWIKMIFKGDYE